jgi:hypothetical protein
MSQENEQPEAKTPPAHTYASTGNSTKISITKLEKRGWQAWQGVIAPSLREMGLSFICDDGDPPEDITDEKLAWKMLSSATISADVLAAIKLQEILHSSVHTLPEFWAAAKSICFAMSAGDIDNIARDIDEVCDNMALDSAPPEEMSNFVNTITVLFVKHHQAGGRMTKKARLTKILKGLNGEYDNITDQYTHVDEPDVSALMKRLELKGEQKVLCPGP